MEEINVNCLASLRVFLDGTQRWNHSSNSGLPSNVSADALPAVFNEFFIDKIIKIRSDISYERLSTVFDEIRSNLSEDNSAPSDVTLTCFKNVSPEEVEKVIRQSSSFSCALDPFPT